MTWQNDKRKRPTKKRQFKLFACQRMPRKIYGPDELEKKKTNEKKTSFILS